ncbi:hypothetical protein [Ornithinibacillus halophilus]|uniref:Lipoprotein n=1 Tax=Ornithinibacillus halophilus TaxID=930117 RepID=A0A1M5I3U9_9BACI|nr:hypothetical protein [Ornithinibacillus halophilus]SHG22563.1 hypothetical protein SAMN05216225_102123 [Ornithinibacillus halophilus]
MKRIIFALLIINCIILLSACQATIDEITITDDLKLTIDDYLSKEIITPGFDGELFVAYDILDHHTDEVYVWAYISEYYLNGKQLEQGTAVSLPVVLIFGLDERENLIIKKHQIPRDGSFYTDDIKKLFSKKAQRKIFDISNVRLQQFTGEVEEKAKEKLRD